MDDKNYMEITLGGTKVSGALAAHIASVSLKDSIEALDSAQITFQLPEAIWYEYSENNFDWYGKEWKIVTFAAGSKVKEYGGDIVALNWQRSGGAPCQVTLTCIDHMHRLKKPRKSSKADDRKFKSKTEHSEIVKLVANDWGLSAGDIQSTKLQADPWEWKSDDLSLLKKLADDTGSVVRLDFSGKKLNFTKRDGDEIPLVFGVQILDISGAHDISGALSKVSLTAENKVKASAKVKGEALPAKVKPDNGSADYVGAKLIERMGGAAVDEEFKSDKGETVDQSALEALAEGKITAASSKFVNGQMTCVFLPKITAGSKVKVSGAGWPLDGTFIVTEVTHSFDPSGYRTQVNFTANGIAKPTASKKSPGAHITSAVK